MMEREISPMLHLKLPDNNISGSKARPCDFDHDGDIDIFIGGRHVPQAYPLPASGYLYRNIDGVF